MTFKKSLKLLGLSVIVFIGLFILNSGRTKQGPTGGGGTTTNVADKNMNIILNNIPNLPKPNNRNLPCPAPPNLGGGNSTPATNINETNKYYCVVTVKNTSTSSWGTNGIKTKIWDVSYGNQITVQVPGNKNFRITVDYYEMKNGFWTDNIWGRGKWSTEQNFNAGYSSNWAFSNWIFVQRLT